MKISILYKMADIDFLKILIFWKILNFDKKRDNEKIF